MHVLDMKDIISGLAPPYAEYTALLEQCHQALADGIRSGVDREDVVALMDASADLGRERQSFDRMRDTAKKLENSQETSRIQDAGLNLSVVAWLFEGSHPYHQQFYRVVEQAAEVLEQSFHQPELAATLRERTQDLKDIFQELRPQINALTAMNNYREPTPDERLAWEAAHRGRDGHHLT